MSGRILIEFFNVQKVFNLANLDPPLINIVYTKNNMIESRLSTTCHTLISDFIYNAFIGFVDRCGLTGSRLERTGQVNPYLSTREPDIHHVIERLLYNYTGFL